jgi:hypothetical protein
MIAGLNPLLVISTSFTVATVGDTVAAPVTVVTAAVDTGVAYDVTFGVAIHVAVAYGVSVIVVITTGVAVSIGATVSTGVPPVGWTVALGPVVGP